MDPVWLQYLSQMGMPGTQSGTAQSGYTIGNRSQSLLDQPWALNAPGPSEGAKYRDVLQAIIRSAYSGSQGGQAPNQPSNDGRQQWEEMGRRMGWLK